MSMTVIDLVKIMIPILASFIGSVIVLWQKLNRNQEKLFAEIHALKDMIEYKLDVHDKATRELEFRVRSLEVFKDDVLRSGIMRRRDGDQRD